MHEIDPRRLIDDEKMSTLQIAVVGITVLLNGLDGFDVAAIAFASPGITEEWGISRAGLGVVLSMELWGMALGSLFLGRVGDKIGRRPTLLGCLIVMTLGMLLATTASTPYQLSTWRVLAGLGIGGMLSCTNAVVAEFANARQRGLCIALMVIGYPLGATFGGMFSSVLLQRYDWRSIFYFGASVTAVLLPIVYCVVPESLHWLARKQPPDALRKINATLLRMRHAPITALPRPEETSSKRPAGDIFSPAFFAITLLVTAAYFLHITTFYFMQKWIPQLAADMGFTASQAAKVLTTANLGGALGGIAFGVLAIRIGLRPLTIAILVLTAAGVAVFGHTPANIATMSLLAAIAGFFSNAGISGLYSIAAVAFPTHIRATGTGFVIGLGRFGAIFSPIVSGLLIESGAALATITAVMAMGSLLGAVVLCFLKLPTGARAK
jgi:benzoate transport